MKNTWDLLQGFKSITIETDEENPTVIAQIVDNPNDTEPIKIFGNYRVRFSPKN